MRNSPPPAGKARARAAFLGATLGVFVLSGCAGTAAWDRDILAKQAMSLNTHPNVTALHDHIYFSKEGASGGRTSDGGGCGCN